MKDTKSEAMLAASYKQHKHRSRCVRMVSVRMGRASMIYGVGRLCLCGQFDIHERHVAPSFAVYDVETSVARESTCSAIDRSRLGLVVAGVARFWSAALSFRGLSREPRRMPDWDTDAGEAARYRDGKHVPTVCTLRVLHLRDAVVYTVERLCQCGQRDVHHRKVAPGTAAQVAEADVYRIPCTKTRTPIERVVAAVLVK